MINLFEYITLVIFLKCKEDYVFLSARLFLMFANIYA